jgi:hypothetical protein
MILSHDVLVIVPSPLEGKGYSGVSIAFNWVRGSLRHNASYEATPSPKRNSLQHLHALSREGRGRSNSRLRALTGLRP